MGNFQLLNVKGWSKLRSKSLFKAHCRFLIPVDCVGGWFPTHNSYVCATLFQSDALPFKVADFKLPSYSIAETIKGNRWGSQVQSPAPITITNWWASFSLTQLQTDLAYEKDEASLKTRVRLLLVQFKVCSMLLNFSMERIFSFSPAIWMVRFPTALLWLSRQFNVRLV